MSEFCLSVNMAMTLDGKVARPDGKWYGLTSPEDKRRMDVYRSEAEVLILGKNSLLNDNPVIRLRYAEGKNPRPVILLRKGIVPKTARVFADKTDSVPLVFTSAENADIVKNELGDVSEIFVCSSYVSPREVVGELKKRGYTKLLLEGGPTLNHAFLQAGLIDIFNITLVPYLIGANSLPAVVDGKEFIADFAENNWKLVFAEKFGDEVFLRYKKC